MPTTTIVIIVIRLLIVKHFLFSALPSLLFDAIITSHLIPAEMNFLESIEACQAILFSTHDISVYKDGEQDNEIVEEIIPLSVGDTVSKDYIE